MSGDPGRRDRAAIFVVALVLRLLYLRDALGDPLQRTAGALMDSVYYDAWARSLAEGNLLGPTPFILGPLYSMLLGCVYAVFGARVEAVWLLQALLGSLSCVLLYDVGRRLFSPLAGRLAGLGLALYGLHVYYTALLLPTVLVLALNLWFLRLLCAEDLSGRRAWGAGGVAGLAALAKTNAVLLVPAAWVALAWRARASGGRLPLGSAAALAAGAILTVAPATLHNALVSGELVPIATNGGVNLWKGNGPTANGSHDFLAEGEKATSLRRYVEEPVDPREPVRESAEFRHRALAYMAANPLRTLGLALKKLGLLLHGTELGIRDQYYFAQLTSPVLGLPLLAFGVFAPLGLVGAFLALRSGPRLAPLYAVAAVQVVSFVAVFVLARYRIVLAACLLLFAGQLVASWLGAARSRRAVAVQACAAALVGIAVNFPLSEFPRERGFALLHKRAGHALREAGRLEDARASYRLALDADWQDKDPRVERLDTRLWIAGVDLLAGRIEPARAEIRAVQSANEALPNPSPRIADRAARLLAQL